MNILKNFSPAFLIHNSREVISRFPLVLIATTSAAVVSEISQLTKHDNEHLVFLIMALILSFPLLVSSTLSREKLTHGHKKIWYWDFVVLILMAIYYFSTGDKIRPDDMFRYGQLIVGGHLLVAFIPFLKDQNQEAFWTFNKTLFLRFLLSSLYSFILGVGIYIILVTIEHLFGIKNPEFLYRYLFLFCAFIFQPMHFLKGIPLNHEKEEVYPRGLLIISKYLLIPLISVYGMILVVYGLKILVTMTMPKQSISFLVLVYSIPGIFTLLLINPLRDMHGSWVSKYEKIFYSSEIFLSLLMLVSVATRVNDYGVTESRYLVFCAAVWIFGISLYQIFSQKKNILWIPITLFVTTVLTAGGPWGIRSVSINSQKARLEKLLINYGVLVNNKLVKKHAPIPKKDAISISSTATYLSNTHGDEIFKPWMNDTKTRPFNFFSEAGIESQLYADPKKNFFSIDVAVNNEVPVSVKNYNTFVRFFYSKYFTPGQIDKLLIQASDEKFRINLGKDKTLEWTYAELFKRANKKPEYTNDPLIISIDDKKGVQGMLYIDSISGEVDEQTGKIRIDNISGLFFY